MLGLGHVYLLLLAGRAAAEAIVSSSGQREAIPRWALQSSARVDRDLARVSRPGHDTSSWHHVGVSRCTLMGCLLETGVYDDAELWYSDNLRHFDATPFSVPWVYRAGFSLEPREDQHYLLETHGITSRADLYLNGRQIADQRLQAGSFGGHTYDVTDLVDDENALVVSAHPGEFGYQLIQGFVDWNPSPPDNSTGVWRDIHVRQTGPVSMGPVSVSIDSELHEGAPFATVTVRALAQNLEDREVQLLAKSTVKDRGSHDKFFQAAVVSLAPGESRLIEVPHRVSRPKIWWPRQWGAQPLYEAELDFLVDSRVSDSGCRSFGIRTVSSSVNSHNDTLFQVNGRPFQVLGGGYAPDQFLRWDRERFLTMARYSLDMGLNTIRLEGMLEHPELYEIADELGIMLMVGWVCCSKWEAWKHNHDLSFNPFPDWTDNDYQTAKASIRHEAAMLQTHPSIIAFLVGSDSWPDDRATRIYVDALRDAHWQAPIIASASKRGYPELLGPSGMKMQGPYDWVPPNYWHDTEPSEERYGAAFGFGSELGAGVGTPELGSLVKFLSAGDLDDLWRRPEKDLFHMSTSSSPFKNRRLYNEALFGRYGAPESLDDYLLKAQMMDYEATRAQHEAYASRWNSERPATGSVYWMLNSAWPSLHWSLFDHALHPAGAYFGAKVSGRLQHVVYDYVGESVWLINRSLDRRGARTVSVHLIDADGSTLHEAEHRVSSQPNPSFKVAKVNGVGSIKGVAFLRLVLSDEDGSVLSRNVYWLSEAVDELAWQNSTWYSTPVTKFANLTALADMDSASVCLTPLDASAITEGAAGQKRSAVELENNSSVPAFFIRLNLVDEGGHDVSPVVWSDNYVTLWPGEKLRLEVSYPEGEGEGRVIRMSGRNVQWSELEL